MADAPKPVGSVGHWRGPTRTVELFMARIDMLGRLEGQRVVLATNLLEHGGYLRAGGARVLAVHSGPRGVHLFLPAPLHTLVTAASGGDVVYLADDVVEVETEREAREIEAWRNERRRAECGDPGAK